ncbi:MAG: CHASE3 domain-containing protein [Vulcanimicrobiota bacterium]
MKNTSVNTLVRAGILTLLGLTGMLVVAALSLGAQLNNQLKWTEHTHLARSLLADIERDTVRAESAERGYLFTGDQARLDDYRVARNLPHQLDELQRQFSDNPSQIERVARLRELVEQKVGFMERCNGLKLQGKESDLRQLMATNQGLQLAHSIHNSVAEMYGVEAGLLAQRSQAVARSQHGLNVVLLFGLAVEVVVGLSILGFLSRRLAPLGRAAQLAERVGSGDLTVEPLPVGAQDEIGRVNGSLNKMLEKLQGAADQNQIHAEVVNQASARLAASSKEQAVALQQQSTALQQTSVTLEELSQSANQIAERSREVASRAEATSQAAALGLQSVRKSARSTIELVDQVQVVSERINALGEKTDSIRSIVLTVNDMAERSNVLALNAAILAASAGSEGKSFTIVANEMKSLADQCKEATVQVRDLLGEVERGIQASVRLIEEAVRRGMAGTTYTDEASVAIHQLNGQVHDGSMAFSQIVAATGQQKLAFEQVAEALVSMRQAASTSAESTRQLESTTAELHRLSSQLLQSMESYRRKPLGDRTLAALKRL